jgi:hypothetical protein
MTQRKPFLLHKKAEASLIRSSAAEYEEAVIRKFRITASDGKSYET